jgi:replicative DNA helicase
MAFDIEFEEEVLSNALRDDDFLKRASRAAESHHFATKQHSWIWKILRDTWIKYRERPTPRIFIARAQADFKKKEDREAYLRLLHKLLKAKPKAPSTALEEMGKFVRKVEMHKATEELAEALERDDLDTAEKVFYRGTRISTKERTYTHVRWMEEFQERQAQRKYQADHPEEFMVVPTGLPTLDKILSGGLRVGELGLVMGTTGRGKSVMLNNISHAAIRQKLSTLYIALEMPARQIATRQDSNWTGLRYDQFKTYNFKPSEIRQMEQKRVRMAKRWKNLFHIISWPVRSADLNSVYAALEDLRVEFNFKPSLIIVDSGDHLRAIENVKESFRLQQTEVYWGLKCLAEDGGYAVWSSVHAGREWATRTATAEATSESYDKARIADLVFSLNDPNARTRKRAVEIDDDDEEDDDAEIKGFGDSKPGVRQLEGHLAKFRDGESKVTIPIEADFARMKMTQPKDDDEEEAAA